MELRRGLSAIVTGGASGIGRALALALAEKGIFVTIIDYSEENGREAALLVEEKLSRSHEGRDFPSLIFIRCDVTDSDELAAAFGKHIESYGGVDICINSAGIVTPIPFYTDNTDGSKSWRRAVDINFVAVIDSTRLAIRAMLEGRKPGVIINVASASGLYPFDNDPIYSGSKGGVVMFTRSLSRYKRKGIRVNALCPEFVQTEITEKVPSKLIAAVGGFIPMEMVIRGAFELIVDESKAGSCLWISNRRGLEYWPTPDEENKYLVRIRTNKSASIDLRTKSPDVVSVHIQIPESFEKLVIHTLSHNFRKAAGVVRFPITMPIQPDYVLLKILYAGVNASDVIYSSGKYFVDGSNDIISRLPLDAGFEAVGIVAAVGESVKHLKVGTPAAIISFKAYAEFITVPSKFVLPVSRPDPQVVAMLTSGLTASIALEKTAQMDSGKTVLVTAAAGGTGQFAVQLAKLAGNKVIATCGGNAKARLLNALGVDRVIDYKEENIKTVFEKEFPKGFDIIFESVGGETFDLCLNNALAIYGRLVVIGMVSEYQGERGWEPRNYVGLCEKILRKSQTVAGFWLLQYPHLWQKHLDKLVALHSSGKLKVAIDPKRFSGINSVVDAVEYLHSGKSIGKVVVCIDPTFNHHHPSKL
ncbi:hypothetical protein M569_14256 [Genlisea aurea]|uniref:Enoyl reductase (ER) domain-containing protein n=1 Tax=Genlisea aurea TaxID=192259 RepID=S8DLS5_9LAMI|nr:hypothetical protein M569_14256 [Genlisea aurea]